MILQRGTVKFFLPDKGYGFIVVNKERENDLFFHIKDGRHLTTGQGTPVFTESEIDPDERIPVVDEEIVFIEYESSDGLRALPWGFADEHDRILQDMQEVLPTYRVTQELFRSSDSSGAWDVLWEGKNLSELIGLFPRTGNNRTDRLAELQTDIVRIRFEFEKQTEDGWELVEDPRPVSKRFSRP